MWGIKKGSWLLAAALFLFCAAAFPRGNAQPAFSPPEFLSNGEARLRVTIPAGTSARLDTSTNLIDWTGFLTTGAGSLIHTDSFAPFAPIRHYRAEQLPAGAFTGDHLPTSNGDLVIHPVNHAGFVMTWNGLTIYNDPVTGTYTSFPKADLIFISHDHTDHTSQGVITSIKKPQTIIVATQTALGQFETITRQQTTVLTNGASTNFLGIQIEAVPAYNPPGSGTIYHSKGVGNGYVLTLGGKRIYMSGDTGDIPDTRALQNIDVAFLCMNVPYTMTVTQAAAVTRAFAPKVIYPYHFRNQDNSLANLTNFKSLVGSDLPIEVRIRKWY
jgi:L-ascorbate metabolism protein UlaG (beta-lactamase superfamily)